MIHGEMNDNHFIQLIITLNTLNILDNFQNIHLTLTINIIDKGDRTYPTV